MLTFTIETKICLDEIAKNYPRYFIVLSLHITKSTDYDFPTGLDHSV